MLTATRPPEEAARSVPPPYRFVLSLRVTSRADCTVHDILPSKSKALARRLNNVQFETQAPSTPFKKHLMFTHLLHNLHPTSQAVGRLRPLSNHLQPAAH